MEPITPYFGIRKKEDLPFMVAVITDTNSGMSVQEGREKGVYVLPMPVIVNGQGLTEGVDITHEELYRAMAEGVPVHTSQPSPTDVTELWEQAFKDGADQIVYIPMSSSLSSSCSAAQNLAEKYDGRVFVVDNKRISVTQRSSVLDALYLSKLGKDAEEIRQRLEKSAFDASIYICVSTLKYLKSSNRVTAAGASLATAMGLHPVLNIRGGKLDAQCVTRGDKHSQKTLIHLMEADLEKRFRFIPPEAIDLCTAGTFADPKNAEEWNERVQKAFPKYRVTYHPLSCSIACHVGNDSLAVAMAIRES